MAKQPKQVEVKSTPELYAGLTINKDNKACVIEDVHGFFYIFDSVAAIHILKEARQKTWEGIDKFLDLNKATIECYHENLFKANVPEKQNLTLTAQYCWAKILSLSIDRRSNQVPVSATGRKSTIGLCEYRLGAITVPNLKTPQAQACYLLLTEVLKSDKATITLDAENKEVDRHVTEKVLKQYIIENATRLHTCQDPWRIFQYYRPILIADKLITRK